MKISLQNDFLNRFKENRFYNSFLRFRTQKDCTDCTTVGQLGNASGGRSVASWSAPAPTPLSRNEPLRGSLSPAQQRSSSSRPCLALVCLCFCSWTRLAARRPCPAAAAAPDAAARSARHRLQCRLGGATLRRGGAVLSRRRVGHAEVQATLLAHGRRRRRARAAPGGHRRGGGAAADRRSPFVLVLVLCPRRVLRRVLRPETARSRPWLPRRDQRRGPPGVHGRAPGHAGPQVVLRRRVPLRRPGAAQTVVVGGGGGVGVGKDPPGQQERSVAPRVAPWFTPWVASLPDPGNAPLRRPSQSQGRRGQQVQQESFPALGRRARADGQGVGLQAGCSRRRRRWRGRRGRGRRAGRRQSPAAAV